MAEQVQATLDQMVAPLADLMDRNIFSQSEIHAIVARRRESEYLLRRRVPRKADYLRYIQDELQLEKLRQLRLKKQQTVERERLAKIGRLDELEHIMTGNNKNHIGDPHIVQNIHLLFRRALRKYNKEDVSVYLQYADVCKQLQSFNKLPQVYAEAVQIHPHCSGLWIEAASHEFFHRQSVSAARILLQRALRINKTAKDLWLQSFALEFHHIAKIQGRRTLLQPESAGTADTEEKEAPSPTLYAVAKIVYDGAIQAIPDDVSFRLGFLDLCRAFPYTESIEARIFKTICKDFKGNPKAWIARAAHLLEQKSADEGDESKAAKGFIVAPQEEGSTDEESDDDGSSSVSEDDSERPTKKQRTSETNDSSQYNDDPVLAMIQRAIRAVESSEMYRESVRFLWMYWEKSEEIFYGDDEKLEAAQQGILIFLQELLNNAASKDLDVYNASLALEHSEFYARVDQAERGREVLASFVETALENNKDVRLTAVWIQLAELTCLVQSTAAAHRVLKKALTHISMSDPDYLEILLHLLGAELAMENTNPGKNKGAKSDVIETFQKVLLLAGGRSLSSTAEEGATRDENGVSFGIGTVEQACWQFLLRMMDSFGRLVGVRKTCKIVLHQSKFLENVDARTMQDIEKLVAFFDKCLEAEVDNLKNGSNRDKTGWKKDKVCVRQLFEAAIRTFKDIPSLAGKYQQERLEASLL